MNFRRMMVACGIGVVLLASTSRAGFLAPGSRSGSISVAGSGENSGIGSPSPISETLNIPATGAGNTTGSVWSNGFGDGFGSPAPNTTAGTASSTINLGQVSGNFYSLNANSTFGFQYTGTSGQSYISTSYTFDQQIIISQAVAFNLVMDVTRPVSPFYSLNGGQVTIPAPSETFSGPGISTLSVSAPYSFPPNDVQPMSVSHTFTGTLQPGTYDFASSWSLPTISYGAGMTADNETASVSANFSVSAAVPEPASSALLITMAGVLRFDGAVADIGHKPSEQNNLPESPSAGPFDGSDTSFNRLPHLVHPRSPFLLAKPDKPSPIGTCFAWRISKVVLLPS